MKLEFRILRHEHFYKNTVYLGIRLLRFLGHSFAVKIPIWKGVSCAVTSIPTEVMNKIYDTLLLEVYGVEVIYSDDALEMAQDAISSMKESVSRVLDMILESRR